MKWIPAWLGEAYSKLYFSFREEPFGIPEAAGVLGRREELLRTILSRLRGAYLASVFSRRGRRRVYRLVDPETWVILNALGAKNLEKVKQGVYFNLICKALRSLAERYGEDLISVVLYGSVARGSAKPTSDIDLLVVSDSFTGSVASRIDELVDLERAHVRPEIAWLERWGVYADISYFPLRPEEASAARPIYLDLVFDAVVLFDRGGFFEGILDRLRERLASLGARRVFIGEDNWYWVLKQEVKEGEVVEI